MRVHGFHTLSLVGSINAAPCPKEACPGQKVSGLFSPAIPMSKGSPKNRRQSGSSACLPARSHLPYTHPTMYMYILTAS